MRQMFDFPYFEEQIQQIQQSRHDVRCKRQLSRILQQNAFNKQPSTLTLRSQESTPNTQSSSEVGLMLILQKSRSNVVKPFESLKQQNIPEQPKQFSSLPSQSKPLKTDNDQSNNKSPIQGPQRKFQFTKEQVQNSLDEGTNAEECKSYQRVAKRNQAMRRSIGPDKGKIFEKFEALEKKPSNNDINYIVSCLKNHFVFSQLSEQQLSELAKSMFYCKLKPGQTILRQGDGASSFFIIGIFNQLQLLEKGKIQVLINSIPKKELLPGHGFGELALLYSAPRSATCVALEETYLWGIDRRSFRQTIEQIMVVEQQKNRKILANVKFFGISLQFYLRAYLTDGQKDAIAGSLIALKFTQNEIIVNEGDQASSFYVIAEGKVGCFKNNVKSKVLNAGESFGEQALYNDKQVRQMTIKAIDGEARVLALGKDTIQNILGEEMQTIVQKNNFKWALQKTQLFSQLPGAILDRLTENIIVKNVKSGDKIINAGDRVGQLIVVIEGTAKGSIYQPGQLILEDSLRDMSRGSAHTEDILMSSDGVVGQVDYESFRKQQGSVEKIASQLNEKSRSNYSFIQQIKQKSLSEFVYISKLGQGQFGSVYLIKLKNAKTLFALKYVTREHVKQFSLQKHIQQEKAVLEKMDHPFVLQFYRSFKDNENIYFLTEYIQGMELFDAIRIIGLLDKYSAQFYVASMILMMEYLHSMHSMVYRDLKPENLMVDDIGYLKLIDMGTAKPITGKTFTIIGTPHYMAPEMLSGKGYNQMSDLWAIGVCLYEFICGGLPYGESVDDAYEIYQEIMKKPLNYPNFMTDKSAKTIIEQFLNKTPEVRLGGSYTQLKKNTWFKGFDYDQLLQKQLKPPLKPNSDKFLTHAQMGQLERKNISVTDQISLDTAGQKKSLATPQDSEWDEVF